MNELTSDEKLKIQTNLEYIGLDLNNIPEFIKRTAKYTKNAKGVFKRLCGINGGITVFETRFPRASQNQESTAVPRTRWRSDIRNFSPSSLVFASCGPSCFKKVSNTVTTAVALVVPSLLNASRRRLLCLPWRNRP